MTANVHISGKARALLQRLNAERSTLHYDRQTESYRIGTEEVNWRAGDEVLYLCAVQTVADRGFAMDYSINEEGQRILTNPNYVPFVKRRTTSR